MSSLIPSGSASGTGSMTLAAPVTNSNQTATLPDATGTVMVSGNMPAFSAYQSASQSLPDSTFTKIQFQTKEFDTSNCYSTTNYRFTPLVAGYYQVNGSIQSAPATSGVSLISIYKNGVEIKRGNVLANTYQAEGAVVSALISMNGSTDYLELFAYQSSGAALATTAANYATYFQAILVRAA